MTLGVLLMLLGVQLWCVKSYMLTPKAARFVKQRIIEVEDAVADTSLPSYFNAAYAGTHYAAATGETGHSLTPPSWLKWAALFAGSVLVLQGAAIPK
jgi:hypothetical protein